MKEYPILFSTDMVEAQLESRKTMTRRTRGLEKINQDPDAWIIAGTYHILFDNHFEVVFEHKKTKDQIEARCYYGLHGDLLWVREKWENESNGGKWINFYAGNIEVKNNKPYRDLTKWKPSIHLKKESARIWSQVKEIRVDRLQDITEEDAIAEGISPYYDEMVSGIRFTFKSGELSNSFTAKEEFEKLWRKINGNDWNIGWDINPWVWVVKFKVLSTTGKPEIKKP